MKNTPKLLAVAGCLLASALTANANLIVNGSFEQPTPFSSGGWALYNSIPGWTATGQHPIEIGAGGTYGVTGFDGNNVMELDSTGNVEVSQVATITGGWYNLSFLYAQRSGVPSMSGSFDILWNNSLIASFAPTSTVMALYATSVFATGSDTLTFRGTGTSNSYGALVDDVQLNRVPDGGSTLALLGGALCLIGFVNRRRR
ncbi:MAG: VPDSG-CTERM sorting domain-containing protein [Opitutaceae bacterium]|nr:VPDSG-CTERM sorting domain-containing protein [Opitutaceae bacterium]